MTLSRLAYIVSEMHEAAILMLDAGCIRDYDRINARATLLAQRYRHLIPAR